MRFEFLPIPTLPRLAWAACLQAGNPIARVLHGPWVEAREDAFVEGAWDAPFTAWDFERSAVLAGSGGRVTPTGIRFATPANMFERLQSVSAGDRLFVSNSLAFLLALSGDRLDPDHPHYYLDLLEFDRRGIGMKEKRLRLAGGGSVELHDCCNLEVAPDLRVTRVEKPWGAPPAGYDAYVSLLERTLERVIENAGDSGRRWRYRPLAMISQGYDSTAVAALAARVGCREAVTFLRSGGRRGYVEDSGETIARTLGLAVTSYERNDHVAMPEFREEEFYLEPWGVDRTMVVMERQLAGSLLLSGRSGELVWARGQPTRAGLPHLERPMEKLSGCALGEFRLRTGFLHFPPATIAAIHAPVIHPWNASLEMQSWSIGGPYDKPIARRIAEEAGVPRHLFGQAKKGGPQVRPPDRILGRFKRRTARWPWFRAFIRRRFANRFHPRWKAGSFDVQKGVERMVERYLQALAAVQ